MKNTHWNNVPKCVQDMFQKLVDYSVNQEIESALRKVKTNERILNLQQRVKQLHTQQFLIIAEARHQAVHLNEQKKNVSREISDQIGRRFDDLRCLVDNCEINTK